ncbi:MAG: hypothetical protein ACLR6I_07955 [Waltera sp.]
MNYIKRNLENVVRQVTREYPGTPGNGTETGRKDDNAPKTDGGNGAGICNTG